MKMSSITNLSQPKIGTAFEKLNLGKLASTESFEQTNSSPSFVDLLKETGGSALQALKHSEELTHNAALGIETDSQKVALGVLNATSATRQLTSILSAGIPAFKEIQHMQI